MKIAFHIPLAPSATLAMNTLVQEKRARGEIVHNLSVGEPIIETPRVVQEAAIAAIRAGKTLYPPVAGILELRGAAAVWMNETYGTKYDMSETLITCGGKFGLYAALQGLLFPNDEVLIIAPYWASYPEMVKLCGGAPKIIETPSRDWKVRPEMIVGTCTERTKVLIINNGANPTGVTYTKNELELILQTAREKNLIVISDEVYSGLTYEGEFISCGSFGEFRDRVVVVQSCSKHFAMTGWRVGMVFAPRSVITALTVIQSQSTTGTASISQWAALAALEHAKEIIPNICREMRARRDGFTHQFETSFGAALPRIAAGLYSFFPLSLLDIAATDDVAWCQRMLEEGNVALVPGSAFGVPGYVRASFGGKRDDLASALAALEKFVQGW